MMNDVIVIGGGKGGVGKSILTLALVDVLRQHDAKTTVIETDTDNPDVARAIGSDAETLAISADEERGWIMAANAVENARDNVCVISTGARMTDRIILNVGLMQAVAKEQNRRIRLWWPINRQRDSLTLLATVLDACEGVFSQTVVWRNLYFGEARDFALYERAEKTRARVSMTCDLPALNDAVMDKLSIDRKPPWRIETASVAERYLIERWRAAYRSEIERALSS